MNIDQLCVEVNQILKARRITVADARTASTVTPRNVRYYQTIGLLESPTRSDGRAIYSQSHVDQIVAIKIAQQNGVSLEQLIEQRKRTHSAEPVITSSLRNLNFDSIEAPKTFFSVTSNKSQVSNKMANGETGFGWSIHFDSAILSGQGVPPTRRQIDAIREVLAQTEFGINEDIDQEE